MSLSANTAGKAACVLTIFALLAGENAAAADKKTKIKMACDFPAAEAPQKIKPGAQGVSDGVVRITPMQPIYEICDGCAWDKSGAKWKVTPNEYRISTPTGIAITISRKDGSALFAVTSKADDYYQSGHAESRGVCKEIGGK